MLEEKETKEKFKLPNKKILVTPVRRKGSWLPANHAASFLFKESYYSVTVPRTNRGELVNPLTEAEQEYFEGSVALLSLKTGDLSIHKTVTDKNGKQRLQNFWTDFKIKLKNEIMELDLSKPMDYLRYKVLLANSEIIAPSGAEKFKRGTYKFALVEQGWEDTEKVKSAKNKQTAYRAFGKMDSSPEKLKDFLSVYYTIKPGGKTIPVAAKLDFLIAETEKIVENDMSTFLDIVNDKDYDTKVMITKALRAKALEREGSAFRTPEGKTIGQNLKEAISFLTNPLYSEEVIKIQSRIDNAK